MITVFVGPDSRDGRDVDEHWLCNEIDGRRRDHVSACVRVAVKGDDVYLNLKTPGCPNGFGVSRPLTARESKIVELWHKLGLDQPDFSCGNVHAFLTQLARLL